MSIINLKPITPGRRFKSVVDYRCLSKDKKPEKSLLFPLKKTGGRNSAGRLTMKYIGGGSKKMYRAIDFKRREFPGVQGTVKSIEYDPNRNAFISAVYYENGAKRYILTPDNLAITLLASFLLSPIFKSISKFLSVSISDFSFSLYL